MSVNKKFAIGMGLLGPVIAINAYSEVYMTNEKAVSVIFPGENMQKVIMPLTAEQIKTIESASGENVRLKKILIWKNSKKDLVVIDSVLGKHEFITYAVGISANGKVKGIEILEYKESYGKEIKREAWRQQFVGKTKDSKLVIEDDIKNISGATLSSVHITAGVKRLLQTYEVIKSKI